MTITPKANITCKPWFLKNVSYGKVERKRYFLLVCYCFSCHYLHLCIDGQENKSKRQRIKRKSENSVSFIEGGLENSTHHLTQKGSLSYDGAFGKRVKENNYLR